MAIRYAIRTKGKGARWLGSDRLAEIHPEMVQCSRAEGLGCGVGKKDRALFMREDIARTLCAQMCGKDGGPYAGYFVVVEVKV